VWGIVYSSEIKSRNLPAQESGEKTTTKRVSNETGGTAKIAKS
jgi:hypothetical protein